MKRIAVTVAVCLPMLLAGASSSWATSGSGDDNGGSGGGGDDPRVEVSGSCTGGGKSKLKLDREDGARIETEYELEHIAAGQRWRLTIRHNGTLVTNVVRTSTVRGRIELRRELGNRTGADRIRVVAQRLPRGQRCTARATAP
jgi:hypothetical protein